MPHPFRLKQHRYQQAWMMLFLILAGSILVTGCGPKRIPDLSTDPTTHPFNALLTEADCSPLADQTRAGGTIVLALSDSVDCNRAPVPHNYSEQIVFGNLYQTLVNVDCSGRLLPGIAQSWQVNEDHTEWEFVLRDTRFWDGTRIAPDIIKECWSDNCRRQAAAELTPPWLWFDPQSASIQAAGQLRLRITLREPNANLAHLLAHPAYAVAIRRPGWIWPVGSGPCRLRPSTSIPVPDLRCQPNIHHPVRPVWDNFVFRVLPGADPRDLLTPDCDAAIARDRISLDYFAGSPGLQITPLPWDRLYVLVCPVTTREDWRSSWLDGWQRDDLARNVAGSTACALDGLFFLAPRATRCRYLTGGAAMSSLYSPDWDPALATRATNEIVFPDSDPDSRLLAHRIAATATTIRSRGSQRADGQPVDRPGIQPQAAGLSRSQFNFSLFNGSASAYILPVPRSYASSCIQLSSILCRAEWLQRLTSSLVSPKEGTHVTTLLGYDTTRVAEQLLDRQIITPLIATRNYLVTSRPLAGLRLWYNGTFDLSGLGLLAEPETLP